MKKRIVIVVAALIVVCLIIYLLMPILKKDTVQTCTYKDDQVKMEVNIPKQWSYKVVESFSGSDDTEGSPDYGINIFIGGKEDEKIYVFRQEGHISLPEDFSTKEEFTTKYNLKGTLYKKVSDDLVELTLVFEDGFTGAIMNIPKDTYTQNEKDIVNTLKSIRIQ